LNTSLNAGFNPDFIQCNFSEFLHSKFVLLVFCKMVLNPLGTDLARARNPQPGGMRGN
jgi:hypothetical protein